jgi:hypothetical protein
MKRHQPTPSLVLQAKHPKPRPPRDKVLFISLSFKTGDLPRPHEKVRDDSSKRRDKVASDLRFTVQTRCLSHPGHLPHREASDTERRGLAGSYSYHPPLFHATVNSECWIGESLSLRKRGRWCGGRYHCLTIWTGCIKAATMTHEDLTAT